MDTKKFLIEYNRMCNNYEYCVGCPLKEKYCSLELSLMDYYKNNPEYFAKIIATVKKWSKENPKKENDNERDCFTES